MGCGYVTATQHRYHIEAQFAHLMERFYPGMKDMEEINDIQEVRNQYLNCLLSEQRMN
ncbi:hypothetical protein ACI2OX_18895 [Bacillus sp. N9]